MRIHSLTRLAIPQAGMSRTVARLEPIEIDPGVRSAHERGRPAPGVSLVQIRGGAAADGAAEWTAAAGKAPSLDEDKRTTLRTARSAA